MQRALIATGIVVLAAGLLWPWLSRLPFFRLPGDFVIDHPHFKFYFPLTTMILISAILTILFSVFRK